MKQTVTKEIEVCDKCKTEGYMYRCLHCGAEYCWRCVDEIGVKYAHDTFASGAGDGFYCRQCDIELSESKADAVHQAYHAIRALRDERRTYDESFDRRRKLAAVQLEAAQRNVKANQC